jgi:hypothetical protein
VNEYMGIVPDRGERHPVVVSGASIDDWVFGIAAVGQGGHESLINAYVPRSRSDAEIKFAAP